MYPSCGLLAQIHCHLPSPWPQPASLGQGTISFITSLYYDQDKLPFPQDNILPIEHHQRDSKRPPSCGKI